MSVKEKPFFDATKETKPLPGFFFSNPVVTGFLTILMCVVFGAVAMFFFGSFYGTGLAREMFELMRGGAIATVLFGGLVMAGLALSLIAEPVEAPNRLQFVFGGALAIALLAVIDHFTVGPMRAWLDPMGRIFSGGV